MRMPGARLAIRSRYLSPPRPHAHKPPGHPASPPPPAPRPRPAATHNNPPRPAPAQPATPDDRPATCGRPCRTTQASCLLRLDVRTATVVVRDRVLDEPASLAARID